MHSLLEIQYREHYKTYNSYDFDNKGAAFIKLMEIIYEETNGPLNYTETEISEYLYGGVPVWMWEWKRKGCGNYFVLVDETITENNKINMLLNANVDDCVVVWDS